MPNTAQYYLALSTAPEVLSAPPWANVGFRVITAGTSTQLSGLPQDGNPVYGRLWYVKASGGVGFEDYSWKTAKPGTLDAAATLIAPLPPQPISNDTILSWNPGQDVSRYMLMVGSSPQILSGPPWADLFSWSGTDTSVVLRGQLPTDGSSVYVRLWSRLQGSWHFHDYTFQTEALEAAVINKPQTGVPIGNSSIEFQWGAVSGASEYMVSVATSPAALDASWGDIFVGRTTGNSLTAYNIPLLGRNIYVRLWTSIKGSWLFHDYQFSTEHVVPAALFSPSTTQVLDKHAQRFAWTQGSGATDYLFAMATDPALLADEPYGDIFTASTTENEIVATGLPLDGNDIHVRLWSRINDEWFHRDTVFQTTVNDSPPDPLQECTERGWHRVTRDISGRQRQLLVKGPGGVWTRGVMILLHGGGGSFTNWCNDSFSYPQWQFAHEATKQGYAVIALDSTDDTLLDESGQNCGKRFDAVSEIQGNIDLPFLSWVLDGLLPSLRPPGSSDRVFVSGISNGGYMTTRIATHFGDRITAFAPVAAGDPYGTRFYCDENVGTRPEAPGMYIDRETGLNVSNEYACLSSSYPNEMPWDTDPMTKPPYFLAYHTDDGVVDRTCVEKLNTQLMKHGYPSAGAMILTGGELDPEAAHFWQPEYNEAIIDFFNNVVR